MMNMESRLPRRDFVFAWDMHYSCNYRCPYCFYTEAGWTELAKKNRYQTPAEWGAVWERIHGRYGRCQLRVTAGEPFNYPRFPEVVAEVSRRHDIQVTSNCSHSEAMRRFAGLADPGRVEIDCTFHPLRGDFENFSKNVTMLRAAGFVANVCYLAYPPQLPRMGEFKRRFAARGIYMNLAIYWGRHQDKQYPFAYTQAERKSITEVIGHEAGPETVNLDPIPIDGKLCGAGSRYAVVHADGRVYRCGQLAREEQSIGNIFDEDFALSPKARPCTVDYCRCKEYQSAWEEAAARKLDQEGTVSAPRPGVEAA